MISTESSDGPQSGLLNAVMGQPLQAFFKETPDDKMSSRWNDIWEADFLPFDRGKPNPALDEALEKYLLPGSSSSVSATADNTSVLPSPIEPHTGRRRSALVPGCGRGYDVLLLAAYGFDAVGLEISTRAIAAAYDHKARVDAALAQGTADDVPSLDSEQLSVYKVRDAVAGYGSARFVEGDFFGDPTTWEDQKDATKTPAPAERHELPKYYDLVVDYTFLCAFPPSQRPKWAVAMRSIMSGGGESRLLCVEFPTYKDPQIRGPPWAMRSKTYLAVLGRPGQEVQYDDEKAVVMPEDDVKTLEDGKPLTPDGMIRIEHYKASRTHEVGKDTDHVGIWKLARD